ncbi:MAG TPA: hypothetical protein VMM55_00995 [Thermohalobaculum sp.]|nr:hypothetical protein [Thermohalobaculum sp.]
MASAYGELAPRDPHSKTGRVWALAEEITRSRGRRAARAEVIDAYVAEGGNPDTASTQYWHWKKAYEARQADRPSDTDRSRTMGPVRLIVGPDGRIVIPSEMRSAMEIGRDGIVTARVIDGELRLLSAGVAVRRAQDAVRARVRDGTSLADELIAERRAEARREDRS